MHSIYSVRLHSAQFKIYNVLKVVYNYHGAKV